MAELSLEHRADMGTAGSSQQPREGAGKDTPRAHADPTTSCESPYISVYLSGTWPFLSASKVRGRGWEVRTAFKYIFNSLPILLVTQWKMWEETGCLSPSGAFVHIRKASPSSR